jgi:hypothetical protein
MRDTADIIIIISLLMSPLLGTGLPYGLHIIRTADVTGGKPIAV